MTYTNTDVCSICLGELVSDITTLSCKHVYHTECIDAWKAIVSKCPYCQTVIPKFSIPVLDEELEKGDVKHIARLRDSNTTYNDIASLVESGEIPRYKVPQIVREINIPSAWVVRLVEDRFMSAHEISDLFRHGCISHYDMQIMISRGLIKNHRDIEWFNTMMDILH